MDIYDYRQELRASIADDGAVKTASGGVIGFINPDGTCGDTYDIFSFQIPIRILIPIECPFPT